MYDQYAEGPQPFILLFKAAKLQDRPPSSQVVEQLYLNNMKLILYDQTDKNRCWNRKPRGVRGISCIWIAKLLEPDIGSGDMVKLQGGKTLHEPMFMKVGRNWK